MVGISAARRARVENHRPPFHWGCCALRRSSMTIFSRTGLPRLRWCVDDPAMRLSSGWPPTQK